MLRLKHLWKALSHVRILEELDFYDTVISIKASDVLLDIKLISLLLKQITLYVGITEAGTIYRGTIKSAVGIGSILLSGVGDTIRVSLTGHPVEEIKACKKI